MTPLRGEPRLMGRWAANTAYVGAPAHLKDRDIIWYPDESTHWRRLTSGVSKSTWEEDQQFWEGGGSMHEVVS